MRRRRCTIAAAVALLGIALSFHGFWTAATTAYPALTDRADAIVVLTGGAARIDSALALLSAGKADRLYVSGANPSVGAEAIVALRPGLPAGVVGRIEVDHSRDTAGNAAESAGWLAANDLKRVILVTAYYHMPRSLLLFRQAAPAIELLPYPVEPPGAERARWWRSARGTTLILSEWLKYLATRIGAGR